MNKTRYKIATLTGSAVMAAMLLSLLILNIVFNNRSKNSLTSIGDGMNCTFEHVCSNS